MARIKHALLFTLFFICIANTVSAGIGIGKDFLNNDTIILKPGDEYTYQMYLTNTEDRVVQSKISINVHEPLIVQLVKTNDLISSDVISLPAKTYSIPIKLKITTPYSVMIGQRYRVDVKLLSSTSNSSQMVTFSNEISEHFYVQFGIIKTQDVNPVEEKTTVIIDNQGNTNFVPTAVAGTSNISGTVVKSNIIQTPGTGVVVGNLFTDLFKTQLIVVSSFFLLCFAYIFKNGDRRTRMRNSSVFLLVATIIVYFGIASNSFTLPYTDPLFVAIIFNVEILIFIIIFEDSKNKVKEVHYEAKTNNAEVKKVLVQQKIV
jgi:hypothetical protein